MNATRQDIERYIAKQQEIIDDAVRCKLPLRPTIVSDALAEIQACQTLLARMESPARYVFESPKRR